MSKGLVLLILILTGCFKNQDDVFIKKIEVQTIAQEVQIPKSIMNELEIEVREESKTIVPVYLFIPLEVQFTEINSDVLAHSTMLFALPKGGGHIDLKNVVTGFGSFYLSFPSEQFENLSEFKPELLHLYYISNSPIKKIDNENFGLGCGKMIDLKKNFNSLKKPQFLKLNTEELRYLHVAAGRYIFIFKQSLKVFITQLTITDSRYSKALCLGANF